MKYHTFPNTDLSVSQLCFGCWGVISDAHWGARQEDESWQAMQAAVDSGVNFFDTAPMYGAGASETLLGKFVSDCGNRANIIIATKISPNAMRPEQVLAECDNSLRRLKTDYIDLYQTHWTNREVPLTDTWGAMQQLQAQGKVRHIGVSNMGLQDLNAICDSQLPLTNQLPYNLLSRMIEAEILPYCVRRGIGVLVYSPLLHGILAKKYYSADEVPEGRARTRHFRSTRPQTRHGEPGCEEEMFAALKLIDQISAEQHRTMADVALAWAIQQSGIVSVVAGARNSEQLHQNLAFLKSPLPDEVCHQLTAATNSLKSALGSNPDMWDGGANSRYR